MKRKLLFLLLLNMMNITHTMEGLFKSFASDLEKTEEELLIEEEFFYEEIEPEIFETESEAGDLPLRRLSNEEITERLNNEVKRLVLKQQDLIKQIATVISQEQNIGMEFIHLVTQIVALQEKENKTEQDEYAIAALEDRLAKNRNSSKNLNAELATLNEELKSTQKRILLIDKKINELKN